MSNCTSSSTLSRSHWKRLLTCRSSMLFFHKNVLGTWSGLRFILRK